MLKRKSILSFMLALSMVLSMVAGAVTVSAAPAVTPTPSWAFTPRQYNYPAYSGLGADPDEVNPHTFQFDFPGRADWGYSRGFNPPVPPQTPGISTSVPPVSASTFPAQGGLNRTGRVFEPAAAAVVTIESVQQRIGNAWVAYAGNAFVIESQSNAQQLIPPTPDGTSPNSGLHRYVTNAVIHPGDNLLPGVYRAVIRGTRQYHEHFYSWTWVPSNWTPNIVNDIQVGWNLTAGTHVWQATFGNTARHNTELRTQTTTTAVYFVVHDGRIEVLGGTLPPGSLAGNVDFGMLTEGYSDPLWANVMVRNPGWAGAPVITVPGSSAFPAFPADLPNTTVRLWGGHHEAFEIDTATIAIANSAAGGVPIGTAGNFAVNNEHTINIRPVDGLYNNIPPSYRQYTFTSSIIVESDRLHVPFVIPVSVTVRRSDVAPVMDTAPITFSATFGDAFHGNPASQTRTLTNLGFLNLTNVTATLVGDNADAFAVTNPGGATPILPLNLPGAVGANANFRNIGVAPLANLAPGTYTATLLVNAAELDTPFEISITYIVNSIPFDLVISHSYVDFGQAVVGYDRIPLVPVTITNVGTNPLSNVHVDIVHTFNASFYRSTTTGFSSPGTIFPGQTVTVFVRPQDGLAVNELYYASLRVRFIQTGAPPSSPNDFTKYVPLTFSVASPELMNVEIIGNGNFGSVLHNAAAPAPRNFIIRNEGDAPLLGVNLSLEGANAGLFALNTGAFANGATIPVGGQIIVTVAPIATATAIVGDFEVYLAVTTLGLAQRRLGLGLTVESTFTYGVGFWADMPGAANWVARDGDTWSASFPTVTIPPSPFTIPAARNVRIFNDGSANLAGISVALVGPNAASFTLTPPAPGPFSLNAGEQIPGVFTIVPSSNTLTVGTHVASIRVTSATNQFPPTDLEITFVVESAFNYEMVIVEGDVDFGAVNVGYSQIVDRVFNIRNVGDVTLSNVHITLEGPNADAFVLHLGLPFVNGVNVPVFVAPFTNNVPVSVRPASGLLRGTYTARLQVTADELAEPVYITLAFAVASDLEMRLVGGNWFYYIDNVRQTAPGIRFMPNYWYPAMHGSSSIYKEFGPGGVVVGPANGIFDGVGIFQDGHRRIGWTAPFYPVDTSIWHYATSTGFATGDTVLPNPWAEEIPVIGSADIRLIFSDEGILQGVAYGIYGGHFYWHGLRGNQFNAMFGVSDFVGWVNLEWLPQGGPDQWIYVRANGSVPMSASLVMPNPWPGIIAHAGNIRVFFNAQGFFTHWELA